MVAIRQHHGMNGLAANPFGNFFGQPRLLLHPGILDAVAECEAVQLHFAGLGRGGFLVARARILAHMKIAPGVHTEFRVGGRVDENARLDTETPSAEPSLHRLDRVAAAERAVEEGVQEDAAVAGRFQHLADKVIERARLPGQPVMVAALPLPILEHHPVRAAGVIGVSDAHRVLSHRGVDFPRQAVRAGNRLPRIHPGVGGRAAQDGFELDQHGVRTAARRGQRRAGSAAPAADHAHVGLQGFVRGGARGLGAQSANRRSRGGRKHQRSPGQHG